MRRSDIPSVEGPSAVQEEVSTGVAAHTAREGPTSGVAAHSSTAEGTGVVLEPVCRIAYG